MDDDWGVPMTRESSNSTATWHEHVVGAQIFGLKGAVPRFFAWLFHVETGNTQAFNYPHQAQQVAKMLMSTRSREQLAEPKKGPRIKLPGGNFERQNATMWGPHTIAKLVPVTPTTMVYWCLLYLENYGFHMFSWGL